MSGSSARLGYTNDAGPSLAATMAIPVLTQIPGVMPVGFTTTAGETAFLYTLDALANYFQVEGDIVFNRVTVTSTDSPYTVTDTDYAVDVDTSGGAVTVTMPASPTNGRLVVVTKITTDANLLTIGRNGKKLQGASANVTTTSGSIPSYTWQYDSTALGWWLR